MSVMMSLLLVFIVLCLLSFVGMGYYLAKILKL